MPSVGTHYEGRVASPWAEERLTERIWQIAMALRPAHRTLLHLVKETIPSPVLIRVPATETDFVEIGDVRVHGVELLLTDSREDQHRFPFTFIQQIGLNHLRLPDIRGTLVTIEDKAECGCYKAPRIRAAECFLAMSCSQTLRYELEKEFDLLMAYVRLFHMPHLLYWRYKWLPHFSEYRRWAESIKATPKKLRTIAGAVESWRGATKWHAPTEWSVHRIPEEDRARLEAEGTVEAIALGALIDMLRAVG